MQMPFSSPTQSASKDGSLNFSIELRAIKPSF